MNFKLPYNIWILPLVLLLASCNGAKHLAKTDSLYVGPKVVIKDKEADKKERKVLVNDLKNSVRPRPNTKTLGLRLKLGLYNMSGTPKKKKGPRAWLHNKAGEPPVAASTVNLKQNEALILNVLQNRGFFKASVTSRLTTSKQRKTKAYFDVTTGGQFTIKQVSLAKDSDQIYRDIDSDFKETLLLPGAPYNLDLIKAEFSRIDKGLKERGYYYFNPNYIVVKVDTSLGANKINMYVTLKEDTIPDRAYNVYNIRDIYIYTSYRLGKASDTDKSKATVYEDLHIIDTRKTFAPSLFSKTILFNKGDIYSADDQNRTLSRLVNLGTFKFVKNRFQQIGDTALDAFYYLTPFPRKSLRFEIGALTQNDNRVGTEGSISWRNRNSFRGGEELLFKINGGIEKQYGGGVSVPNIYNFGVETDLTIPHFVVPFADINSYSQFIPKTIFKVAYKYESESNLLRIQSYSLSYGYDWKEDRRKEHRLFPFNFVYVKTDTLGNADRLHLLYANLVFNGIIIGPTYEFTYNSQGNQKKKDNFYFDGLVDLSGNILGIAQHADYKSNPQTILGSQYAQYLKFQTDFRYYHRFSRTTLLANRLFAGVGFPYGNSYQLPNVKQFWAGGNSDLRGFPSRLVGPGTFNEYATYHTNSYLETLGDIKLEFNTELRKTVYKILGLAMFFDAGNIWLYNSNPTYPGATFTTQFYKQLAADLGVGLRLDFQIFIVRLDVGMPVYEPWLKEGSRLVLNKVNFGDGKWRSNNLVFNFGIGYPF